MSRLAKNFIAGVIFIAGIALALRLALVIVTKHGAGVEVPDMVGRPLDTARDLASGSGLTLVVTDSVFVSKIPKGAVYHQNPSAHSKVKSGRTVYITVNSLSDRQVPMPNLVGLTLRQARTELTTRGFTVGDLEYVPDIATNNVLAQLLRGSEIAPGTVIPVSSVIDLRLGRGEDGVVTVPHMTGLKYHAALDFAQNQTFNVRRAVFDRTVVTYADSLDAFVYKQYPEFDGPQVPMGTSMTLYFTLDSSLLPSVEEEPADSLSL